MHLRARGLEDGEKCVGRRPVGEPGVHVREVAEANHRVSADLAEVGTKKDLARVLDDRLRDTHLVKVEVEQRAIQFDTGDTDNAEVDLELTDELERGLASHAVIPAPYHTAGDDRVTAAAGRQVFPTLTHPAFVTEVTAAGAANSVNLNLYDFEFGKQLCLSEGAGLRLYFGPRFASLDQKLVATYSGGDIRQDTVRRQLFFDGGGVRAGGELDLRFLEHLGVYLRGSGSLEDSTRFDLARDTKQALAYAAITAALARGSSSEPVDAELLGEGMKRAVDILVARAGFSYKGVDPRSFEPVFATAGGRLVTLDGLPTRARHLVAFAALTVRTLWEQRAGPLFVTLEHHFDTPDLWRAAIDEHAAVMAAIERHDPGAARAAMRRHMDMAARRFQRSWSANDRG